MSRDELYVFYIIVCVPEENNIHQIPIDKGFLHSTRKACIKPASGV
jgi:hypothetical protein